MEKIKFEFPDKRDEEVFRILLRTYKEINFIELRRKFLNAYNLIERCLRIRCAWVRENYYENITYWGTDLQIDPNVYILFLSRLINSFPNIKIDVFVIKYVQLFLDRINKRELEKNLFLQYQAELYTALDKIWMAYLNNYDEFNSGIDEKLVRINNFLKNVYHLGENRYSIELYTRKNY